MAPSSTNSPRQASPKRLSELLQEKQEPSVLEVYLLEIGNSRISKDSFSAKNNNYDQKQRSRTKARTRIIISSASDMCQNIARSLLNKVVSINEITRLKHAPKIGGNLHNELEAEKEGANIEEAENTSNGTQKLNHVHVQTKPIEPLLQVKMVEADQDCSPVSVLDRIEPLQLYNNEVKRQEEASLSNSQFRIHRKVTEECLFSASLWELLVRTQGEKNSNSISNSNSSGGNVVVPSNACFSRYINLKRAMQNSKQLMLDCVREAVKNGSKVQRKKEEQLHLIKCPEEFGKVLCGKIIQPWEKQRGDVNKKLIKLIRSDLAASFEERMGFEGIKRQVGKEIGDMILGKLKDELFE